LSVSASVCVKTSDLIALIEGFYGQRFRKLNECGLGLAFVYKCVFLSSVTQAVLFPQAQAHTPPPKSTFRSRRPRPMSRGNLVTMAAL